MVTDFSSDECFKKSETIVGRPVGDEYILVPIISNAEDVDCIYNLSGVAASIWELFDGRKTLKDIHEAIIHEFEVVPDVAFSDIRELVGQLLQIKAIEKV